MQLITREESQTSPKFGRSPGERSVEELLDFGIVVIDKPSGPTSHQVSAYVQQILSINKSGHSGTLDPKVTGVLPVALGAATRLVQYLLKAGKEYICVMHLHGDVPEATVREKLNAYTGTITQLPPKRSAVARRNRQRTIYEIEILEIQGRDVLFRASVEAGTYIRKYCHDAGILLGVGAHMAELRRTRAAIYDESQAVSLQTLSDAYHLAKQGDTTLLKTMIAPAETIIAHLPAVVVLDSAVNSLTHGATLKVPGIAKVSPGINEGDVVRLLTLKEELIGTGIARLPTERMLGREGVAVKPDRILLSPDVYPRMD